MGPAGGWGAVGRRWKWNGIDRRWREEETIGGKKICFGEAAKISNGGKKEFGDKNGGKRGNNNTGGKEIRRRWREGILANIK